VRGWKIKKLNVRKVAWGNIFDIKMFLEYEEEEFFHAAV
jgi:hypothetical protein